MTSHLPRNNFHFGTVSPRFAGLIIVGITLLAACASLTFRQGTLTDGITEVRSFSYPGLATGIAAQESGTLIAAVSNRNLIVVDTANGATLYQYSTSVNETCGQGVCWITNETAFLFSTGNEVHCVDVHNGALSRSVAATRHFRITQLLFHNNALLIAGEVPGDFGVYGHVEVWQWKGVGQPLTKEHDMETINGNAHAISFRHDNGCCIAATASGGSAGVTLVRFSEPGEWRFSTVQHIPIGATLVSVLDNERFVLKGPGFVDAYRVGACGNSVVREWVVALNKDAGAQYPIRPAAYRSLDVLDGTLVIIGTASELMLLDGTGKVVGGRRQQTGAICVLGRQRAFVAAHPGEITKYEVQ